LLGELYVDADKVVNVTDLAVYHPLVWNGVKIKLHYATVGELADYLAFINSFVTITDKILC